MIRLVFKIFLAYWLAAGVVIAISDFEPHRHIHNPELTDALDGSLAINGHAILEAYEDGRCLELEHSVERRTMRSISHHLMECSCAEIQVLMTLSL